MKFLFIAIFIFSFVWCDIFSKKEIILQEGNYTIKDDNISIGQTGFVIRDGKYIIDYAFVIANNSKYKKLEFKEYDIFDKDFFEAVDKKPKVGDKIIFGLLNKRAMIICNSRKDFNQIKKDYDNIYFIHPDMLASHLAIENDPSPGFDDFFQVADDYYIGLYFVCLPEKHKIAIVDARTFTTLKSKDYTPLDKKSELPFYTRVKEIDTSIFNFDDERVIDYSKYYTKLLNKED